MIGQRGTGATDWLFPLTGVANQMRHPLDYARPVTQPGPPERGRLREWLSWLETGAALAIGGFAVLGMVVPRMNSGRSDEPFGRTQANVSNLSTALEAFAADTGRYPSDAEGLAALCSRPSGLSGWRGPYLQYLTNDPRGHHYVYHLGGPAGGVGYRVLSMGRDGKEGTADDIAGGSDEAPARSTPPATRASGDGAWGVN